MARQAKPAKPAKPPKPPTSPNRARRAPQPAGAAPQATAPTVPAASATPPAARDYATTRLPAVAPDPTTATVVPFDDDDTETRPLVIPGSGRAMGRAVLPRRPRGARRSRLVGALVTGLTLGIVISALFAVSPLAGGAQAQGITAFHAFSSAIGVGNKVTYVWYVARRGDTVDSIATTHHCQVGGIYELNGMLAGQELQVGKAYKLPTDPTYGLYFRPASSAAAASSYGATVLGDHIWNSYAGTPPDGALCGPIPTFRGGDRDDIRNYALDSFDLKSPNRGAYWVRGFTWYHFGVDLANPLGTPIYAAQAGEVIFANWDTGGGGWSVKINHCNHLSTAYGHMEKLLVHDGQMVHMGEIIGLEGSTGWSTGPHLHFSVQWDNLAVDPMRFFDQNKYNITHYLPDA